jgi:hypothetical protein
MIGAEQVSSLVKVRQPNFAAIVVRGGLSVPKISFITLNI